MAKKSLKNIPGDTFTQKCKQIGITPGTKIDIRILNQVMNEYGLLIVLYFEEELARNSTYEKDIAAWKDAGEHERPFIRVEQFLSFQREMNPLFDEALQAIPLLVEIVFVGTYRTDSSDQPLITGILPFVDEMSVE